MNDTDADLRDAQDAPRRQIALLYSDGSFSVFPPGWPMDKAREERADVDRNQRDPAHLTPIAWVRVSVEEIVDDPRGKLPETTKSPDMTVTTTHEHLLGALMLPPGTYEIRRVDKPQSDTEHPF